MHCGRFTIDKIMIFTFVGCCNAADASNFMHVLDAVSKRFGFLRPKV